MGTARRITLTDITPRINRTPAARTAVLDYCFLSDSVPVGYLRCAASRRFHRSGVSLFLSDATRHVNDCVGVVSGDVSAGFHLFAASDVLQPHRFTLSVPDRVRDRQRPNRLVANTDRLPLLTHRLGWG